MSDTADIKEQRAAEDAAYDAEVPLVSEVVRESMESDPDAAQAFLADYDIRDAEHKWFPYHIGWISHRIYERKKERARAEATLKEKL